MRTASRDPHRSYRGAFCLLLLATAACQSTPPLELVPFTRAMRERYEFEDDELRALQYYISQQIVLERVATDGVRRIQRGRLIVRSGTRVQQVVLEPGTPGIIEPEALIENAKWGHSIEVSFDPGAPLSFSEVKSDGRYTLTSPSASSAGLLDQLFAGWGTKRTVEALFDGTKWRVVAGASAHLMIERDALGELERRRRILPGLRLPRSG